MKTVLTCVIGTIIAAALGAVLLQASRLERDLAQAQMRAVTADYDLQVLDRAERFYSSFRWIPGIGADLAGIRRRKALVQYWQGRYGNLVANPADPLADVPAENVDLQFVVVNAMYRSRIAEATSRPATLAAVDAGIVAYGTVLKNAGRHDDAAFNYEYLTRVRADLARGRQQADTAQTETPHGLQGSSPDRSEAAFKIYVPLESHEREIKEDSNLKEGEAGRSAPIRRKG